MEEAGNGMGAFAPLFIAAIWIATLRVLAAVSGWSRMAEQYHHPGPFNGKLWRFQSARINRIAFNNSLRAGVGQEGLYLVPLLPFRPFFPPLLIPWDALREDGVRGLVRKRRCLVLTSPEGQRLEVWKTLYERMRGYLEKPRTPAAR